MTGESNSAQDPGRPLDRLEWRRVSRRPEMRSITSLQRLIGNRVAARLLEHPSAEESPAPPPVPTTDDPSSLTYDSTPRHSRVLVRTLVPLAAGAVAGALLFTALAAAGEPVLGGVVCVLSATAGLLFGRMLTRRS